MEIPVGSVVGGYRVKRLLGAGGMGAVYLAEHRSLPRDVALKVLHAGHAVHPEFRARFLREAELLSRLDHPHIVDVQDRGEDGGLLWMTMDLVPGPDLAAAVAERGAFPPGEAVRIVEQVAAALDHAHERGLLHRDVKPANVLLKGDAAGGPWAMLTDFGIAKDVGAAAGLTRTGHAPPATYAYAAPEQLTGAPLDRAVDVYALGVLLFELLSGRRAFPGEDPLSLMYAVASGPVPDVREARADVPPALAAVVGRAMAKDPAARPRTCGELAAAARAALPAPAPPTATDRSAVPPPPGPAGTPGPHSGPPADPPTREFTRPRGPAPEERSPRVRRGAVLAAAVVVLAALVALALVIPWSGDDGDDGGGDAAPSSVPGATDAGSTATEGEANSSVATVSVGTCLDAAGATAGCDTPHEAEVVAMGACEPGSAFGYLGGAPAQDVLRTDLGLQSATVAGQEVCVLTGPGAPWSASNQDVLLGRAGDVWRRCGDELGRETPCDEPHTTEAVFEGTGAEELACGARADDYLGKPFDQVADRLRLVVAGTTCVVEVRGDNVLTASLRRLGPSSLPLEAGG